MRSPTTGARTRGSAATGVTGVDGVGFGDGGGGDVEEVGDGDGGGVEWWGAAEHEVGVARPRGGGGGDVVLLLRSRRRPMALACAAPRRRGGRGGGRARAWRRRLGFAVASSPSARSAAAATTTTTRDRAPPPPPPPPPPPLSRGEEDEREHGAAAGHRRWRRGYGESGSSRLHHGRRVPQPTPFRAAARRRGRGRCGGDRSAGEEEGVAVTGARGRRKVWRRPARALDADARRCTGTATARSPRRTPRRQARRTPSRQRCRHRRALRLSSIATRTRAPLWQRAREASCRVPTPPTRPWGRCWW
ncbi:hypothetical protein EE612_044685 [Oryza sativa]|nr:hypothetical protein EE612_044685 [Oryza sativa]